MIELELVVDRLHIKISIVYTMNCPTFTSSLTGSCVTLLSKWKAYFDYKRATELLEGQLVMMGCTHTVPGIKYLQVLDLSTPSKYLSSNDFTLK